MTSETTLTTSWQKVADAGKVLATIETDDEVLAQFASTLPTNDIGHKLYDDDIIQGEFSDNLYMKLLSEGSATVTVTNET